jgi:uncharacterized membrane protein
MIRAVTQRPDRAFVLVIIAAALVGVVVAVYLTVIKLSGALPACLPGGGCETVALSEYSSMFGIPVAAFGLAFSLVLLGTFGAWLVRGDRRLLLGAYALWLFGVVFVAYLTYLELFVIHAICTWCVAYAIATVIGFLTTALLVRRTTA